MPNKRTGQKQAIAVARVRAAASLQQYRPKAHANRKNYNRAQQKRRWQNDQEALFVSAYLPRALQATSA